MIKYKINTSSIENISKLIYNSKFNPPLDMVLDVSEYVSKIYRAATKFEAWYENELVGLLAAYINNKANYESYITLLAIEKEYTKKGTATYLLKMCINYNIKMGYKTIALEVRKNNSIAINLYRKNGFKVVKTNKTKYYFKKEIK